MKLKTKILTLMLSVSLWFLVQPGGVLGQDYNNDDWYDPTDWFDGGYEYDPNYGWYNEDEWYDSTDWFDGNNYEWDDTLDLDYGYADPYDYDEYDYGYDPDDYDYGYDYDYYDTWPNDRYNYGDFNYDDRTPTQRRNQGSNYGWHYDWNPNQDRWISDYGRYDSYYDYPESQSQQQRSNQPRQGQSNFQQANQRVLRGEVATVRTLYLRDQSGQRSGRFVTQLHLDDGRWVLVDLGANRNLINQLKQGNQIVVRGRTGTINGRRVLMANQLQVNGRSYSIRPGQQQAGNRPMQPTQQTRSLTGRVNSAYPINFGDNLNRNCFRLQLRNGQNMIVDLGSRTSLADLDLNPNDLITLGGRWTSLNGRAVFRANRAIVNGETTNIRQTAMNQ